jgi:Fe-S cluster assembly protein SufD
MTVTMNSTDHSLMLADHFRQAEAVITGNSSALLNGPRKKAVSDFIRQGIPTRKNENYKYTSLQPSFGGEYDWIHNREMVDFQLKDIFKCDVPQLDSYLVILLNGWFYSFGSHTENLPGGVVVESLERFSAQNPEKIRDYYARLADTSSDPFTALNTAFATDGYVLFVPGNTKVERPIQIINILQAKTDTFITQRNLVITEPGAELKLIVCDHTLNLNRYLCNEVTEVFAGENAAIEYYSVQNQHNKTTSVHAVDFLLEKNARLTTQTITLHGGLVRNNLKVILNGENSEANLFGMSFMDKKQHVDNFIQVFHEKPDCRSNQHFKNVLDEESSGVFSGRIHVKRDAQKTNAYQRNNNLLLTDKAQMQTRPQLIIEADDVKCSHGATVGQIDEDALFYLRSRGIGENQARLMMMNAFSYEVVRQIGIEPLRDRISELVDKRLRGDVGRCHECAYHCDC